LAVSRPSIRKATLRGTDPPGGQFNAPKNTPIAPPGECETITLNNGEKLTVNKTVAEQFRDFSMISLSAGRPSVALAGSERAGTRQNIRSDTRSIERK
jgi:hypothetical protein